MDLVRIVLAFSGLASGFAAGDDVLQGITFGSFNSPQGQQEALDNETANCATLPVKVGKDEGKATKNRKRINSKGKKKTKNESDDLQPHVKEDKKKEKIENTQSAENAESKGKALLSMLRAGVSSVQVNPFN